ncbi:transporter [Duganella vulcania]|uniref:Transporter n=1 Tax=Duganella vulcania TaxID=2692166 RepID=A0A845GXE6_9BURK|nr:transporter [Duganella vulcania]MYM97836.1 transporter [Duganella vulcania]
MKTTLAAALCLLPLVSQAEDGPPITPYRPSVSSPAQLPAAGQLELELGGLSSKSDDGRRNSLPYALKLGFNEQWGVVLVGEGFVSAPDGSGGRARGVGDTQFVLKRAFILSEASALGLELGAKAPTAKDSIGSGRADYSLNGIYSQDMGSVHMDANLNATRLGAYDAGTGRVQTGLSASFSTPVDERWGVTGEWSGTRRSGAASTAQVLVAMSYSPSKRMTVDFGAAHGMNRASPDWAFFSGVVLPLAQLW